MNRTNERMMMMMTAPLLVSSFLVAVASSLSISTPEDYKSFLDSVNSGNSYSDETVYLNNDLDLGTLGVVEPIGKSIGTPFLGTFDGQGHTISNLLVESAHNVFGMFGTSDDGSTAGGVTVKNVILDPTCLIHTTSQSSAKDWFFIAGIMGSCSGFTKECRIEGCVNMARVSHAEGVTKSSVSIGGIVGGGSSMSFEFVVQNCANYGDVTIDNASSITYIGGIAGYLYSGTTHSYVKECVNYGKLANNAMPIDCLYTGGIMGFAYNRTIAQNCLAFGSHVDGVVYPQAANYVHPGGIFGVNLIEAEAHSSYWRNDTWNVTVSRDKGMLIDRCGGFGPSTLTLEDGTTLYSALKDSLFASMYKVSIELNGGTFSNPNIVPNAFISPYANIPDPTKENKTFCGWCTDPNLTHHVDLSSIVLGDDVHLYAKWYRTISFNTDGGEGCAPINGDVGENVTLPKSSKCGYIFRGWRLPTDESIYEGGASFLVPNSEVMFDAVFEPVEYPLYFRNWDGSLVEGGTVNVVFGSIVNSSYFTETVPEKKGFVFDRWTIGDDYEANSTIKSDYETNGEFIMPCHNITFVAYFVSSTVKIVFDAKVNVSKVPYIINKYVNPDDYTIEEFGEDQGNTYVIIAFKDSESAKEFFRITNVIFEDLEATAFYVENFTMISFVTSRTVQPSLLLVFILSYLMRILANL